jgi:hypothetical protein
MNLSNIRRGYGERERLAMAGMLRRAGYPEPGLTAKQLQQEGMDPNELAWRLRTGQTIDPSGGGPMCRNPLGLSGTDLVLIAGGVAAFGFVGFLIWNQMQVNQEQATAAANGYPGPVIQPASAALNQSGVLASSQVLLGASNILPPPGTPVVPPVYVPGAPPLLVAPT